MVKNARVNQVILIMMDDVRASHLFGLIDEGRLPNIAEISKNGTLSHNCITSYPSVTYPCYSNIVIGCYSGYFQIDGSGIPEYHYVGREDPPKTGKRFPKIFNFGEGYTLARSNTLLGTNCKTIFEQAGEGNFLSSLNLISRGSLLISPLPFTTETILDNVIKVFTNPKNYFESNEVPKVTVAYIPDTDALLHDKGYDHPDYINEIIKIDKGIGKLIKKLKELGYYDSTAIALISDHGNFKAKKAFNLEPFFREQGLIQYQPKRGTGDFDCNIGSVGFFNFPGDNWHFHPTIKQMQNFKTSTPGKSNLNLIEMLWKIPGVKYMYYRGDCNTPDKGIIHIQYRKDATSKINKAFIEYEGHGIHQKTKYIFDEVEFYGYETDNLASKILDKKSHSIGEWMEYTNHINFPMIVDQIPRYFKNPRAGDIVISTLGEYGFGFEHGKTKTDHLYSHDICLRNSMVVPFIIGGAPEIPILELEYCKTTDMVPSLLNILGLKPDNSVVGKSVFDWTNISKI